jgi:hypothetical protein
VKKIALGHVVLRVSPFSFVVSFHHNFIVIIKLEGQGPKHGNIKHSDSLAVIEELWTKHLLKCFV